MTEYLWFCQLSKSPQSLPASPVQTDGRAGWENPSCTQEDSSSTLDNPGYGERELEWIKICLATFRSPVSVGWVSVPHRSDTQEGHRRWEKKAVKILSWQDVEWLLQPKACVSD